MNKHGLRNQVLRSVVRQHFALSMNLVAPKPREGYLFRWAGLDRCADGRENERERMAGRALLLWDYGRLR